MRVQGVYAIINTLNGFRYIGSSSDCARRFKDHRRALNSGTHINPKLLHAWLKYGPNAFTFEVIEEVAEREDLLVKEQELLPGAQYNIATKADRPPGHYKPYTEEEKAAMSKRLKGKPKPWQKGVKQTPELVAKRISPLVGRKRPADVGQKISLALTGSSSPRRSAAMVGNKRGAIPCSDEKRAKIKAALNRPEAQAKLSAAHKGRKQSAAQVAKRVAHYIGAKRTPEMKERMRNARLAFLERKEKEQTCLRKN